MEKLALKINGTSISGGSMPNSGQASLENILRVGINYLYIVVVILALIFIIWGGINWIMSSGDKQKLAQARQKIVFAILGLVIAFLSFAILNFIRAFFRLT